MIAANGWAIIEAEEHSKDGVIELPDTVKGELQRGIVVEISSIYHKEGMEITTAVKKGDRVVYKKYYDSDIEIDGKKYKGVPIEQIIVIL